MEEELEDKLSCLITNVDEDAGDLSKSFVEALLDICTTYSTGMFRRRRERRCVCDSMEM